LFVVAAGNGGGDGVGDDVDQTPAYPCAYPAGNIVCVAATTSSDTLASFSNYGVGAVDIAAPGVDVLSAWPPALGGSYAWSDGTSMATPHVAGVAALVAARLPTASTSELRAAVLDGADDQLSGLPAKIGSGRRLNAYGALTAPAPGPSAPTSTAPAESPAPTAPAESPAPEPVAPVGSDTTPAPAADTAAPPAADTTAPVVSLSVPRRARLSELTRTGLRARIAPRRAACRPA
jgi:thermitase